MCRNFHTQQTDTVQRLTGALCGNSGQDPPIITQTMAVDNVEIVTQDEIGKSAIKKASWRLLPLIGIGYGVAYIDRANISFASLQMNKDLHFSATIYGLGAGLFFLSYAACEIPSNLMLYRWGARVWLSRIMITWGIIATSMMFVRTPNQFYIVRFLLGMAEAGFFPGVIYYLMQWFPLELRARAISRFYISNPLATAVMGALAGALLSLQGRLGLAGWQWLFLLEGLPAIVLSVVFFCLLPDCPSQAKWLTPAERDWIETRIQADAESKNQSHGIVDALRDPRVMQIGAFSLCMQLAAYAFAFSQPAILKNLTGFSTKNVGFLVTGMGISGALAMLWTAARSDRLKERYIHIVVPFVLIFMGFLIAGISTVALIAVPALTFMMIGFSALQAPYLSLAPEFLKKKSLAAGIAAINMIGIMGGFLGPLWMGWAKDHTKSDQLGMVALTLPSIVAIGIILNMRRIHLQQVKPVIDVADRIAT